MISLPPAHSFFSRMLKAAMPQISLDILYPKMCPSLYLCMRIYTLLACVNDKLLGDLGTGITGLGVILSLSVEVVGMAPRHQIVICNHNS